MTVDDFSVLDVARFEVRLRSCESVSLPPFLGSTLRGALGHALKQAVCVVDHGDCSQCPVAGQCVYPYFFETPVPAGIAQLRGQRHAPHPFVLEPPIVLNPVKRVWRLSAPSIREPVTAVASACAGQNATAAKRIVTIPARNAEGLFGGPAFKGAVHGCDTLQRASHRVAAKQNANGRKASFVTSLVLPDTPKRYNKGEDLSFGLTLLGRAIEFLPYVVFAIGGMARRGLGADRAPFELGEVWLNRAAGKRELIYAGDNSWLTAPPRAGRPLSEAISEKLSALHSHRLKLRFLTPARIRVQGDLQTGLSFELLVRNLLRRISTLAAVHGRNHLDLDYHGLLERARTVKTQRSVLKWWDLERYSNRQAEKLKVGGLIGEVEYEGEAIEEYLPLLAAGELLQVGTGTSYGLGRYELLRSAR